MKIILLSGLSGSGKTSIAQLLCQNTDKYNFINSYTDRPMRESNEFGHIFIDSAEMDLLLERAKIAAKSTIDKYRYCSIRSQFSEDKINVYIVDVDGINDTIKTFPNADVMSILIRRDKVEGDCIRLNRDVCVPVRDDVDFIINNDTTLQSVVDVINVLVGFDLFNKPAHIDTTIEERIDNIDAQYRYLNLIKDSLYQQLWYKKRNMYIKLCEYVEENVNRELDFDIEIIPDSKPDIFDGCLYFNLVGEYEVDTLSWNDINRLVERMTHYAHEFCKDDSYMLYNLHIAEHWKGEDEYNV